MLKNISKKFFVLIIIFSLLTVYIQPFSLISFAIYNIKSLETPTNLKWVDNSKATATWDLVKNANYYIVNVYVYDENENLIGSKETGTADNKLDLQQEIFSILENENFNKFGISFDVKSQYINDNEVIESDFSNKSLLYWIDRTNAIKLDTPTKPIITEDGTATWDYIENADEYRLSYKIEYGEEVRSGYMTCYDGSNLISNDGKITQNIMDSIIYECKFFGFLGKTIKFSFKVQASVYYDNFKFVESDYSEYSNSIEILVNEVKKLDTPGKPIIQEDGTAIWDYNENADEYRLSYKIECGEEVRSGYMTCYDGSNLISNDGKITQNIMDNIMYECKFFGFLGKTIKFSFKVQASVYYDNIKFAESDYSEYSNFVEILVNEVKKLDTPGKPIIQEDGTATWDYNENADEYRLSYKIECGEEVRSGYMTCYDGSNLISNDGKITQNIMDNIMYECKFFGFLGKTIKFSFKVQASVYYDNFKFVESDYSEYSDEIYINPNGPTTIDKINLSPNKPLIAVGRSMYIGKTIEPADAYYSTINWSTSDDSVVSINDMGQITGLKKGKATITAQINNASESAEVSVYEIETNISDKEESKNIIDQANKIIEALITSGKITNTDIIDILRVINEIRTGAEDGNIFNVDIKYVDKIIEEYNNLKEQIFSKFGEFCIAGGNDIKIEISHTDNSGSDHHIANIIELENDLSIEFNLPNMPELPKSKTREYKLIRCHNGDIEEIDFEIKNGKVKSKSDKFSDFILLYKDIDGEVDTEIRNIIKNIPKYYVLDMEKFQNNDYDVSGMLETYIKQVINDDTIEISVDNVEGGGNFTFMEWAADVNIFKNGELYDTVHLGWEDGTQITTFALITVPLDVEKSKEAYIMYAKNLIENKYNWPFPYEIYQDTELIDGEIVLFDTEKFGTIKYNAAEIATNFYTFIPAEENAMVEPLMIMQENIIGDVNGDGKITLADYTKILAHVKKTQLLTGDALKSADVNGDGKVTLADYTKVLAHVKKTALLR